MGCGRTKPPKATLKPAQSLLIANRLRPQSYFNATLKPPQSHPNATPMLPQCYPKASGGGVIGHAPAQEHLLNVRH
jgi:hypothetical protein